LICPGVSYIILLPVAGRKGGKEQRTVGYLYHPKVRRKDGTIYEDPIWWAKFYVNGRPVRRSTKTHKKGVAARQLRHWEGNPIDADPKRDRATLDELAEDFLDDQRINKRKSIDQAEDHVDRLLKTRVADGPRASR
jgi:hypothetical protein